MQRNSPKLVGPRGRTILPFIYVNCNRDPKMTRLKLTTVRPWKIIGSSPGPRQKAKVQTASAPRSSKPSSILFRPSWPRDSMNDLLERTATLVLSDSIRLGSAHRGKNIREPDCSHIWTGQSLKSVEFQGRVLSQGGPVDLIRRISLLSCPFLPVIFRD
jgi:hypothetical protein